MVLSTYASNAQSSNVYTWIKNKREHTDTDSDSHLEPGLLEVQWVTPSKPAQHQSSCVQFWLLA